MNCSSLAITQLSEDQKPKAPRFSGGIKKRGQNVIMRNGAFRVKGIIAPARGIGDHITLGGSSSRCKNIILKLSTPGTRIIVQCSDGITDVLSSQCIMSIAKTRFDKGDSLANIAAHIISVAFLNDSDDNLSCIIRIETIAPPPVPPLTMADEEKPPPRKRTRY